MESPRVSRDCARGHRRRRRAVWTCCNAYMHWCCWNSWQLAAASVPPQRRCPGGTQPAVHTRLSSPTCRLYCAITWPCHHANTPTCNDLTHGGGCRGACAYIDQCYQGHSPVGIAARPQPRSAHLLETRAPHARDAGGASLPPRLPVRTISVAVHVNNQCDYLISAERPVPAP